MGGEIGQPSEWNENAEISWELLESGDNHSGIQKWVKDLNRLYCDEPALWDADYDRQGFYWVDCQDNEAKVISFVRQNSAFSSQMLIVLNLASSPRYNYRIGVPYEGFWHEILNSDSTVYGGNNCGNLGGVTTEKVPWHGQPFSTEFTLPLLSCLVFRRT